MSDFSNYLVRLNPAHSNLPHPKNDQWIEPIHSLHYIFVFFFLCIYISLECISQYKIKVMISMFSRV